MLEKVENSGRSSTILKDQHSLLLLKKMLDDLAKTFQTLQHSIVNDGLRVLNDIGSEWWKIAEAFKAQNQAGLVLEKPERLKERAREASKELNHCIRCYNKNFEQNHVKFKHFLELNYMKNWISYGPVCVNCLCDIQMESQNKKPEEIFEFVTGKKSENNNNLPSINGLQFNDNNKY